MYKADNCDKKLR